MRNASFKSNRGHRVRNRMQPLRVVEHLDGGEAFPFNVIRFNPINVIQSFCFQCPEERFVQRMVPTVSLPAHALDKVMGADRLSEAFTTSAMGGLNFSSRSSPR